MPGTSWSNQVWMEVLSTAEDSVKWQLCYNVRAKTWWMVSDSSWDQV